MSTIQPGYDNKKKLSHQDNYESMTLREQIQGIMILILLFFIAVLLRSL